MVTAPGCWMAAALRRDFERVAPLAPPWLRTLAVGLPTLLALGWVLRLIDSTGMTVPWFTFSVAGVSLLEGVAGLTLDLARLARGSPWDGPRSSSRRPGRGGWVHSGPPAGSLPLTVESSNKRSMEALGRSTLLLRPESTGEADVEADVGGVVEVREVLRHAEEEHLAPHHPLDPKGELGGLNSISSLSSSANGLSAIVA